MTEVCLKFRFQQSAAHFTGIYREWTQQHLCSFVQYNTVLTIWYDSAIWCSSWCYCIDLLWTVRCSHYYDPPIIGGGWTKLHYVTNINNTLGRDHRLDLTPLWRIAEELKVGFIAALLCWITLLFLLLCPPPVSLKRTDHKLSSTLPPLHAAMQLQPDSSVILPHLTALQNFTWTIFSIIYMQHSNNSHHLRHWTKTSYMNTEHTFQNRMMFWLHFKEPMSDYRVTEAKGPDSMFVMISNADDHSPSGIMIYAIATRVMFVFICNFK